MDRLVQRNVLAMSGRAVEAAGDVNTLLLDKTGTITIGNREAGEFLPVGGVDETELADAAQLSTLADETPEGRSVVVHAKTAVRAARARPRRADARHLGAASPRRPGCPGSTCDGASGTSADRGAAGRPRSRKGAAGAVIAWVRDAGGTVPAQTGEIVDGISASGGTPLVVAEATVEGSRSARVLGVIHLKDVVKDGMRERFDELRRMGIRTVMITGDNPLTARAIADEAGVDDFLAEATPEDKMALIRREQEGGKLVAMTGDGTNDAPALAQADVGVAMNTGTSAAKEAGNMVDLDSNPTKLIEIVEIGKQLLITRGALTTFSIANDVAKYFAIIPAMFAAVYPGLDKLNIMRLTQPGVGDPVRGHLQRADHHRADPAGAARRAVPAGQRRRRCCAATSTSTASAGSSPRSSASRSSTCSSSSSPGSGDRHVDRSPRWLRQHLAAAARAARPHRRRRASPTRWSITGVAQIPGLKDKADGSLVKAATARWSAPAMIGQSFTDADGNPLVQYFQSRPSAAGDRLRPDRDQRQQPRPGEHRRHPRRPGRPDADGQAEPAHPGLLAQPGASASSRTSTAAGPSAPSDGVGAGARASSAPAATTGPITRVVSLNQACPTHPFLATYQGVRVECATPGEDYAGRRRHPDPGRRPDQPGRCPPTRSPPAAAASTPTSAPPTRSCRPPRIAARPARPGRPGPEPDRRAHERPRPRASSASPRVNVLDLNLALDRQYPLPRERASGRSAESSGEGRRAMPRGELRVYLGAAPGVGKTYAMLDEGRRRLARGTDVVVGLVETHGRARTAELLDGLEVVPRRELSYRGATLHRARHRGRAGPASAGRAGRRARPHQRARAHATPSAGRTSRSCSTPAST